MLAGFTAVAILVIAAVAILSTTGGGNAENFTPNNQGLLPVGSEAPTFTAETLEGTNVSVGDGGGDGEATMLVFFATWCPHCQEEAPIISDMESQYEDLRIVMAGIDGQDDSELVQDFVDRYDISSPAVYDPSLGPEYNVSGYPTVYFIDGGGEIVATNSGEAPREVYEDWAEEALSS